VLLAGCSGPSQDEQLKNLILQVSQNLSPQKEAIIKPYQGLTADQLQEFRSIAVSAQKAAEPMKLSDKYSKSRGLFIQGMNATITAVDTLEKEGKIAEGGEKIPTDSVSVYFISTQTKIGDALDLIGVKNDKGY
jgi:soluble cytochrome b562